MQAAMNDLDRAIIAIRKSKAGHPELMRRLREGKLWFLVPYHPEIEDHAIHIEEEMDVPFAHLKEGDYDFVPVYSSFERAREGMKQARFPGRMFSAGSMDAIQALQLLAKLKARALLNFKCRSTGEVGIPSPMLCEIADGSALAPETGPLVRKDVDVVTLNAADYPTDLLQPMFEVLRKHAAFRAAWVFLRYVEKPSEEAERMYQFVVIMNPKDDVIFHDLKIVSQSALPPGANAHLVCSDENNTDLLATLWPLSAPFYTAPDYVRPPDAKGEEMGSE